MDDFEKYIKENRHLFDDHRADKSKMWDAIESQLDTKPTIRLWQSHLLKIAATILILLGVFSVMQGFLTSKYNYHKNNSVVHQELQDIDSYYSNLVSFQVQLVKNNPKLQPESKKEFLSFMDELDEEYSTLKQEMEKNLDNEYILEAIVNNYKKRIELIENLLKQINDSKNTDINEGYIL